MTSIARCICRCSIYVLLCCGFAVSYGYAQEEWRTLQLRNAKGLHLPLGASSIRVAPAFEDYSEMMFDICDAMKLEIKEGECLIYPLMTEKLSAGALATEDDGTAAIVYDRTLSVKIGYVGAMGVIAHEVGHHYCRHLNEPPSAQRELEADRFSGAVLRLTGNSLSDSLAMTSILSPRPSRTHPSGSERERAISEGWNNPESAKLCR